MENPAEVEARASKFSKDIRLHRPRDRDCSHFRLHYSRIFTAITMTSIQARRPLQINLAALLQQPNPTIDLGIQSYEASTRNFLKAVTNYKNRAMATIAERRKHQAQEKKKILDKTAAVETEIAQCKLKEIELVARKGLGLFFFLFFRS